MVYFSSLFVSISILFSFHAHLLVYIFWHHRRVKIEIERVEPHLLDCLVPRDEADGGSAIVEIRAGTGGAEAAIFAADLLSFYERLAARRGWRIQHMTASFVEGISDTAIKEITCSFNGTDVFGTLKVRFLA